MDVGVTGQSEHGPSLWHGGALAALPARLRGALRLDLRPQGLGFLCSSLQVGAHFVAVPEVEGDDGVDVGQSQGVVGADHIFRPHAVIVLLDDEVEADATLADADGAPSSTRSGGLSAWRGSGPAGPSATVAARSWTTTGYNFEYDLVSLLREGT